ncbi:endonuclease/exonuclease/phosphatase family protein [Frondihabitans cladoniiphilus]|uniref:Endonuclease/exonuclease/phosphatase domain-containing protein n=1 Tax=Frondihabitans cladoniiphilus TaxID=715785 RepID=A0ABP8VQX0_9MICO
MNDIAPAIEPGDAHPAVDAPFTVMSYNLWKNAALGDLPRLVDENPVDILCLQEARTGTLPHSIGHLTLTALTANDKLGLAVYARASRFRVEATRTFRLMPSMHDRLRSSTPERLIAARLIDEVSGASMVVASFHASPLTALNRLRRRQIDAAHALLQEFGEAMPTLMIGDFNYPWFARRLGERLSRTGFTLSRGAASTYHRFPIRRGVFDLVTSTGLGLGPIRTLAQSLSDHLPIVVTAACLASAASAAAATVPPV